METLSLNRFPKDRLDAIHITPGDARNKVVEEIVTSNLVKYGVLAIHVKDESMRKHCQKVGIPFYCLGFTRDQLFRQYLSLMLFLLIHRPRSVYMHSYYPSMLGAGLFFLRPFTKVISVRHHNAVHLLSGNRRAAFVDKLIQKFTYRTIAVSNTVRDTMIQQGCNPAKINVIYNGIRIRCLEDVSEKNSPNQSTMRLLAAGRLDWQKNYETMLQVAIRLKARKVPFNLNIIGSGGPEYSSHLFGLTKSLGLEEEVHWLGWQEDIEFWFSQSDILIHTALDEACPLVLIEALMFGLPVISSDAGGSFEVTTNFAQTCGPNDTECFVDKLISTWDQIGERRTFSLGQVNAVAEKFGVETMCRAYSSSVVSILSRSQNKRFLFSQK